MLGGLDWAIIALYFLAVLAVGILAGRATRSDADFFLAGRAMPAWVSGIAFVSANLGAQEVIGMGASGAKYGLATAHFYWVGAIPAMAFLAVFMMPFYYGSGARSAPEYLRLRFDEKTRTANALSFAVMTIVLSGISMYAMARLVGVLGVLDRPLAAVGLPRAAVFHVSVGVSAAVVLAYISVGGLRGAIFNEVLQFVLIVAGFTPLVLIGLADVGGWGGLAARLPAADLHVWRGLERPAANPLGVDLIALLMGLGFVLSFGYWCSDFLVVQRAMAARSMGAARRAPLIAAFAKTLFPALVVTPGLIALALTVQPPAAGPGPRAAAAAVIPAKLDPVTGQPKLDARGRPELDYDLAVPNLLLREFPTGLLGLGLTALLASFMSGMAGNVTAFNTVFTYDLYAAHIRPNATGAHYLRVGRLATVAGVLAAIGCAYLAGEFNNLMDLVQLVMAFVNAPVFAVFLLGMFWPRATGDGAFAGLLAGPAVAALHHGLTLPAGSVPGVKGGWIAPLGAYPSEMAQNFWTAIWAFGAALLVAAAVSLAGTAPRPEALRGLVAGHGAHQREAGPWLLRPAGLAGLVLLLTLGLNLAFR